VLTLPQEKCQYLNCEAEFALQGLPGPTAGLNDQFSMFRFYHKTLLCVNICFMTGQHLEVKL
jgi:hypothetical protein